MKLYAFSGSSARVVRLASRVDEPDPSVFDRIMAAEELAREVLRAYDDMDDTDKKYLDRKIELYESYLSRAIS